MAGFRLKSLFISINESFVMDNVQFPISNLGEMVVVNRVNVDDSSEVNADELVGEVPFTMETCWLVGTK